MKQITDFSSLESINNLESQSEEIISSTNVNRNSDEFCDRLGLFFKSKSMDIKSEDMLNETKIYKCYNELDKKSMGGGNENNFSNVSSIKQNDFIDVMNKKCNFNDFISATFFWFISRSFWKYNHKIRGKVPIHFLFFIKI